LTRYPLLRWTRLSMLPLGALTTLTHRYSEQRDFAGVPREWKDCWTSGGTKEIFRSRGPFGFHDVTRLAEHVCGYCANKVIKRVGEYVSNVTDTIRSRDFVLLFGESLSDLFFCRCKRCGVLGRYSARKFPLTLREAKNTNALRPGEFERGGLKGTPRDDNSFRPRSCDRCIFTKNASTSST
jgi:hypothetical protein